MAAPGPPDQRADFGTQHSKQDGGTAAGVIVHAAFDLARTHGQPWCGSIQSLYLAFLVDAQDQSAPAGPGTDLRYRVPFP
jgi:hypothetical protein